LRAGGPGFKARNEHGNDREAQGKTHRATPC